MLFAALMGLVVGITLACFAVLLPLCVGIDRIRSVVGDRAQLRQRAVDIAPFVGGLAVVLLVNKGLLDRLEAFSFEYGFAATETIYAIEGDAVAGVQSALPDWGLYYFGPMYVFGYVVLLIFPLIAYAFADTLRPLKRLVTATPSTTRWPSSCTRACSLTALGTTTGSPGRTRTHPGSRSPCSTPFERSHSSRPASTWRRTCSPRCTPRCR